MKKYIEGNCYCPSPDPYKINDSSIDYYCRNCFGKDPIIVIEVKKKKRKAKNG